MPLETGFARATMATPGRAGRIMSREELVRHMTDLAGQLTGRFSTLTRDLPAAAPLIETFNILVHCAYHSLQAPYRFEDVMPLGQHARWGELMYGIGRMMRILHGQTPDPGPIVIPNLITPSDFLQQSRKPGLSQTERDVRGPNLMRVDVNLVWFHLACKGELTNLNELKSALVGLENSVVAYFAGKYWFSRGTERQNDVRKLQGNIGITKMHIWEAELVEPIRDYANGRVKIVFPDSRFDVVMMGADTDLPNHVQAALKGPSVPLNEMGPRGDGLTTTDKVIGRAEKVYSILESGLSVYQVGRPWVEAFIRLARG